MGELIRITVDDKVVLSRLADVVRRMGDATPALKIIGERVLRQTEERFDRQGPAPDGTPWAPLAPATRRRKKHPKILTESGQLRGSIRYQVLGPHAVAIGTNKVYGAIQQLGGTIAGGERVLHFRRVKRGRLAGRTVFAKAEKAHFGQKTQGGNVTIPARPYLGISAANSAEIVGILDKYIMGDGV